MAKQQVDKFAAQKPIEKLSVLMAAYNESKTIEKSTRELFLVLNNLPFLFELLVIESNSSDGTREILKRLNNEFDFKLILEQEAKGKGAAIRNGMNTITGDVFVIFDADLEYDPSDLAKLLIPIERGETSFVLGTRHENGKSMRVMDDHVFRPYLMNLAHKFFTKLINIFLGVKLTDPFTMWKIFRTEVFANITLESNRFDLDWELVIKAIRVGSNPKEIPIQYTSRGFSEGKKIKFFSDPISWINALIKFKFQKLN